jgi:energy-coupling factor transporter transmembrane protein EcfT
VKVAVVPLMVKLPKYGGWMLGQSSIKPGGTCIPLLFILFMHCIIYGPIFLIMHCRISWSAFVGMFIARISKGRTLSEIVLFGLVFPIAFCMIWFCVWGGIALRQSRQGLELMTLGATYFNNSEYFLADGSKVCYDVPQEDIYVNNTLVFHNYLTGVTPVCQFDSSQSSRSSFDALHSFSFPSAFSTGLGPTLSFVSLISIGVFFITSSDSASLAVYYMSANGM